MKFYKVLDLKKKIIETEGCLPETVKTFFRCGIVLYRRDKYDKGIHDNDVQDCEIRYRNKTDEQLRDNYNKLYNLIILKYGN